MTYDQNPYLPGDKDRHEIWEGLVRRDIEAFLHGNWNMTRDDFEAEGFFGIDGGKQSNPDLWKLNFPNLEAYRDSWLRQASETEKNCDPSQIRQGLYESSLLKQIDIQGDRAVVHKQIKGPVVLKDGSQDILDWQTLYICRKVSGRWKITSFVGYLPSEMGGRKP